MSNSFGLLGHGSGGRNMPPPHKAILGGATTRTRMASAGTIMRNISPATSGPNDRGRSAEPVHVVNSEEARRCRILLDFGKAPDRR